MHGFLNNLSPKEQQQHLLNSISAFREVEKLLNNVGNCGVEAGQQAKAAARRQL